MRKALRQRIRQAMAVTVLLVLTAVFCGCDLTLVEPEEVVGDFFKALKTKNEDVLILYTKNEDINMLLHSKGDQEKLDTLYSSVVENLTYDIGRVKKNKNETAATVEVQVANADFSNVLEKYESRAYTYMQDNLYAGDLTKKKLNAKCLSIFVEQVEKAAKKAEKTEKADAGKDAKKKDGGPEPHTLVFQLKKNDHCGWDMELTTEQMETIIGGLIIPL